MPDFGFLLATYGPWLALAIVYLLPRLDKLAPWLAQERKSQREVEAQREERLIRLLEQNTVAFTDLRASVSALDATLREVRTDLREVREDVARIYVQLDLDK
jgi:hypothetical protein